MAILLMDPTLGAHAWVRKAKYNKKISEGKLDEVTDDERYFLKVKLIPTEDLSNNLILKN